MKIKSHNNLNNNLNNSLLNIISNLKNKANKMINKYRFKCNNKINCNNKSSCLLEIVIFHIHLKVINFLNVKFVILNLYNGFILNVIINFVNHVL